MDGGTTFPFNIVYTNLHKRLETAKSFLHYSYIL